MNWSEALQYISTAIGSGALTGFVTYFTTSKKRKNDFIAELQGSIALLSENYTKTLSELIEVKRQYTESQISLSKALSELAEVKDELSRLRKENETLIKKLNELNKLLKIKAE